MTRERLLNLLTEIRRRAGRRARRAVEDILSAALPFSGYKGRFTFSVSRDLDARVNALLIALSDGVLDDVDEIGRGEEINEPEEDKDAIVLYIHRPIDGKDATERVDAHSSHLKYLLEGYLAVCFARSMTNGDIIGGVWAFLTAPFSWGPMRVAFADKSGYDARIIRSGGFHFGRGEQTDAIKGLELVASYTLDEALQFGDILRWRRAGAIGYRCHRGSDYDCLECDAVCAEIHPLDEIVLPVHPRCMCYTTPVYGTDD